MACHEGVIQVTIAGGVKIGCPSQRRPVVSDPLGRVAHIADVLGDVFGIDVIRDRTRLRRWQVKTRLGRRTRIRHSGASLGLVVEVAEERQRRRIELARVPIWSQSFGAGSVVSGCGALVNRASPQCRCRDRGWVVGRLELADVAAGGDDRVDPVEGLVAEHDFGAGE